ncbi:MAG: hypothetical protein H6706_25415 [Myxococcales bacterium]|nr:hypothetical protein [Myxococcales bacterium]
MRPTHLIWLALASPAFAQAPEVAMLSDLQGRVEVRSEAAWIAGRLDQGLAIGDGVRTWPRSSAEIHFVDGTVLMLTERTRIRITTALFNPGEAPVPIQVALAAGGVDVRAGRQPLSVASADGGVVEVAPGESAFVSIQGEGPAARLLAGPPQQLVSVDVVPDALGPPDVRGGPEPGAAPAGSPAAAPGAAAAGTIEVGGGGHVVIPDLPAPAETPPTQVRVRVRVRTP